MPSTHSTTALFSLLTVTSTLLSAALAQQPSVPNVPWASAAQFEFQPQLSDEFDGTSLDLSKWDPHGLRNPDTGCPQWNGPVHADYPDDSTFYPSSTDPITKQKSVQMYQISGGELRMKIQEQPLSFFTQREYYCNATTFTCNHNPNINCFATNFNGEPIYTDASKTQYQAVIHDKCKTEPFCIPHPVYVSGKTENDRQYYRLASSHLTSTNSMQYGFLETKVQLGDTPAVAAVWLHDDDLVNGYCRFRKSEGPGRRRIECPSLTRSRRWQEIDLMEAMNSTGHSTRYVPNIHSFAMYKGEFSFADAREFSYPGGMGGGPIIVRGIFNEATPDFADVPVEERVENDWHWSPGPVHMLDAPWAAKSRTLGLYWSPNEIRFFVDGNEVRRINNSLIHQPMFLDLSFALNTRWSQESPSAEQLEEEVRIDYIRAWKVLTADGADPPPNPGNPLGNEMVEGFINKYGNKQFGVFDRFPVNDSVEVFQNDRGQTVRTAASSELDELHQEISARAASHADYFESVSHQRRRRRFRPAGGPGNNRRIRRKGPISRRLRTMLLATTDRAANVYVGRNGRGPRGRGRRRMPATGKSTQQAPGVLVETLDDAEQTIFEFKNPNSLSAGWAMFNEKEVIEVDE